jgi:hypothetical protein
LLNKTNHEPPTTPLSSARYNKAVHEALLIIWHAANRICSKRLVPFLPEFIKTLEHHRHPSLSLEVRSKLLSMSAATMDRILRLARQYRRKRIGTTRGGNLLKKQITVRTFSDWNEIVPEFMEVDLVAHCGETTGGSFLNTLVFTDIVSGWTELMPLLCKREAQVIEALKIVQEILPFSMLGMDTDKGSKFINYGLLGFCKEEKITFTRSRPYRKND